MPLQLLPLELLLKIFSYLPIQAICCIEASSAYLHDLIRTNQNVVYRAAAQLHGFVDDDLPDESTANESSGCKYLDQALKGPYLSDWLKGVSDWKEYCKKYFFLERAWQGALPGSQPEQVFLKDVHRTILGSLSEFKVDEVERTIIATTFRGRLLIMSIDTQEYLWSLPMGFASQTAPGRLEFSNGFIIVGRQNMAVIDIWRRSVDCFDPSTYLPCSPSPQQIETSPEPVPLFPRSYPPLDRSTGQPFPNNLTGPDPSLREGVPRRGAYLPFMQLDFEPGSHKLAVRHPYLAILLVLGDEFHDMYRLEVWHIPSSRRQCVLQLEPPPWSGSTYPRLPSSQRAIDVEVDEAHVYVCWESCIEAYRLGTIESSESPADGLHVNPSWRFSIMDLHGGEIPSFTCQKPENSEDDSEPWPTERMRITSLQVKAFDPIQSDERKKHTAIRRALLLRDSFREFRVCSGGTGVVAITNQDWVVYHPLPMSVQGIGSPYRPFRLLITNPITLAFEPVLNPQPSLACDDIRILVNTRGGVCCIPLIDRLHPVRASQESSLANRIYYYNPTITLTALQLLGTGFWFVQTTFTGFGRQMCFSHADFADFEPIALPAPPHLISHS